MTSLFEFPESRRGSSAALPIDLISGAFRSVAPLVYSNLSSPSIAENAADERTAGPDCAQETAVQERARQLQVMLEAARDESASETRRTLELEWESRLTEERARIELLCAKLGTDRRRYFEAAEVQVVKLAIAVARRILAREVQADEMHLQAVVGAALARVREESATVLRVPASETETWSAMFSRVRDGNVTVLGDERLDPGACVLETEVGRVELGVQVQLEEIERGFGELLRRQGA